MTEHERNVDAWIKIQGRHSTLGQAMIAVFGEIPKGIPGYMGWLGSYDRVLGKTVAEAVLADEMDLVWDALQRSVQQTAYQMDITDEMLDAWDSICAVPPLRRVLDIRVGGTARSLLFWLVTTTDPESGKTLATLAREKNLRPVWKVLFTKQRPRQDQK